MNVMRGAAAGRTGERWEDELDDDPVMLEALLTGGKLLRHQLRFEELDDAWVRAQELERRIGVLEAELLVGRERIRRLTAELYDGLMTDLEEPGGRGEDDDDDDDDEAGGPAAA
ncbi:MAG: hypothetical protein ACKOWF_18920 [Chloroflexota bacterium]